MEEELAVEERMASIMPGARRVLLMTVGVMVVTIGFATAIHGTPSTAVQASPSPLIIKKAAQIDQCFEENVAYKLGKVKKGKSEWILADEKKDSPRECQNWCQTFVGCQFFTFKQRTNRCILTTARGEKLKKGQKAISGPRVCPGNPQPCQEYLPSTVFKLKPESAPAPPGQTGKVFEYNTQLSGQNVRLQFGYVKDAWDVPGILIDSYLTWATWPKGMPQSYFTLTSVPNFINITVDGDPMEDMIVSTLASLQGKTWKYTLDENTWIPIVDTLDWYHADVIDGGRTLRVEEGENRVGFVHHRLSKPVSKVSISLNAEEINSIAPIQLLLYQGKKC